MKREFFLPLSGVALASLAAFVWLRVDPAKAQQASDDPQAPQITGTPGSPNATTTIDGRYLPNPPAEFGGQINTNAAQS